MNSTPYPLDKLDRAILQRLQQNGRETYDVIGEQVGLSSSAVLRRVKRLEEMGVIERYVALVKPESVGLSMTAYLNVRLEKFTEASKRNPLDLFRASVQAWPEVVECVALTGDMDYLLRVVVADMAHYSRFVMDTLLRHPSVQDCKTSFVLDRVKVTTALPVQPGLSTYSLRRKYALALAFCSARCLRQRSVCPHACPQPDLC